MAETFTFTIKPITDLSDVRANVGEIQRAFSKLKLPPKLGVNLNNELHNFMTAYDKFTEKQNKGIKNNSDVSSLMKASDSMLSSYKKISEIMKQVDNSTIANVFKLEGEEVEKFQQKLVTALQNLSKYQSQLDNFNFKGTDKILDDISKLEKKTRSINVKGYLANLKIGIEKKDFDHAKNAIDELKAAANSPDIKLSSNTKSSINELVAAIEPSITKFMSLREKAEKAGKVIKEIDGKPVEAFNRYLEQGNDALEKNAINAEKAAKAEAEFNKEVSHLENQVESYFGLNAIFRKVADMARQAMETVKELDKAMTETAVVTDFSISDMWEKLPIYTAEANKLGSTIKDVYEATTLYYQQGLNTTQSMGLAVETLKMARIAGMDAKDATDAMTAALRGFNLELNQASAQRINDVYSELAAITASDTQEISTAMEKVASLAHNAGMEVETTSAFLAQMIETTREAPENLGTALKTVIARFQEMKQDPTKLVDSEGVMLDANKVDKALKSIGVNLLDTNGEFIKLDDVLIEIAQKWDTLSMGQQRYIATMAAGSRQQSRFIAMMSDYERTMELVDAAYDANGASQKQFEKTLESMDTKLNQLQNAWNQFTMGLMNNEILKTAVDAGTQILDVINKIINAVSSFIPGNKGLNKTLLTLIATFNTLSGARGFLKTGISSGVKWFKGDLSTGGFFKNLLFSGRENIKSQFQKAGIGKVGTEAGKEVAINFRNSFQYSIRGFSGIFHDILSKEIQGGLKTGLLQSMDTEVLRQNVLNNINEKNTPSWDPLQANQKDLIKFVRDNHMESAVTGISKLNIAMGQFGVGTIQAGSALQSFGLILRGTPLAPFGMALQTAGVALSSFGKLLITVDAQGKITGAGFKALWNNIGGWTGAGIAAAALAIWGIYRAATASKRELQDLSKVAQSASEHLDTTKQNANEFKTTLEQIKENNDAFNGLVPGTLAFNEKLVESNQLILSLVEKFDELRDKLQIDEYGRYFFNDNDLNDFYKNLIDKEGIAAGVALLTDLAVAEKKLEIENDKLNQSNKEFVGSKYTYGKDGTREYSKEYTAYLKEQEKNNERQTQSQLEYDTQKQRDVRNALRNSFTGLDVDDAETAAEVMADTYYDSYVDRVQKKFSDEDLVELYATQNGEDFDEIWDDKESKKAAIKEGRFIAILHEARSEAEEVDKSLQVLNKTAEKVFDTKYGDASSTFTDLFTGNGENLSEELIEDLYNAPEKVEEIVKQVGETSLESLKTLMPDFEGTADELMGAVTKKITNNISSIMAAQTNIYKDTAIWYAKLSRNLKPTQIISESIARTITQSFSVNTSKAINEFLDEISQSVEQADLEQIGSKLFESLMGKPETVQQEISELLNQIDWSSAIERGQFYEQFFDIDGNETNAFTKLSKDAQKFVKETRKVDRSSNLLGKQFEELVQSSDFLEILTDKWKDFANETGQLDASGVEKMAEECGTLNDLLDIGELKASTLATALNYFNETGSFDGLTGAVLSAVNEFDTLDELVNQVKKDIDNFKPGEDYTQGVDAYRNYYKTLKEGNLNHKFSSEDTLKAFYQFIPEEEEIKYIKKHGGDRAQAQQALLKQLDFLESENEEDSTLAILNRLASGKKLLGGTYTSKKFDFSNINGMLNVDAGKLTRDEFIKEMVKSGAMPTEEMARGFLLSLEGMDIGRVIGDEFVSLTSQLDKNGRVKGNKRFIRDLIERELIDKDAEGSYQINGQNISQDNRLILSKAELEAYKNLGGFDSINKAKEALAEALGTSAKNIRTFNEETETANDYLRKRFGGGKTESENKERATDFLKTFKDSDDITNLDNATAELEKSGISASKALDMAVEMAKTAGEEEVKWGKELVPLADIINGEQFKEAVDELEEDAKWVTVGEKIGEAVANVLREHGIGQKPQESAPREVASTSHESSKPSKKKIEEVERRVSLKTDLSQAEANLAKAEKRVEDLNKQIEQKRTIGADTSKLVKELHKAESEADTFKNKVTSITTELNKLDGKKIVVKYSSTGSVDPPSNKNQSYQVPAYKGLNNYISPSGFYTGSMARGNKKGTLGPKNKGGLTLTGERGYEIAWLPSQNRSMILGAHGPQMTNLPADAVVWNHKQSKRIVAQKGIPLGSMDGGTPQGGMYYTSVASWQKAIEANTKAIQKSTNNNNNNKPKKIETDNSNKKRTDWLEVENERYNLNRHINVITRRIDKQTSEIDKTMDKIDSSYEEVEKLVKKQIKDIDNQIKYQEQLKKSYSQGLKDLDKGGRKLTVSLQSKAYDKDKKKNVWKSDDVQINTKDYIKKENGVYVLDRDKINDKFKGANRETVSNALQSELDRLINGLNSSNDAIDKLNEQRDETEQKLADWEPNLPYENFERSSLERWNREQKLNKITESIADKAEALDETLSDITSSWEDILKASKEQAKEITKGQKAAENQRKSYAEEGNLFIAGERTVYADYETSSGASKHVKIDPSQFMTGDAENGFKISRADLVDWMKNAVDENGNKIDFGTGEHFLANMHSIAQTAMDEAGRISDGWNEANDSVKDFQKQQKDLNKQIAEAFTGWKNELTQIYLLTSQIANIEAATKINQTQQKSLTNQIALGIISMSNGLEQMRGIADGYINLLEQSKDLKIQELEAQREELLKTTSSQDEVLKVVGIMDHLAELRAAGADSAEIAVYEGLLKEAQQEATIAKYAEGLINVANDENGNPVVTLDDEAWKIFDENPLIPTDVKKAVQDLIKEMISSGKGLQDLSNSVLDLDVQIQELQKQSDKTLADFEKELASALEAQVQKEIDSMDSLDQSLDNAAQSILEQARQTLDARRQANQNQQTETDINNKEQRLAALRANTAGGNQVEIAQLEKEIAQDRQAYQESLEDQLLDRISKQYDDAKKQREIQIQIARQQLEFDKNQGKFMEQADKMIRDIENKQVQEDIKKLLGGETLGEFGIKVQDEEFNAKISSAVTALETLAKIDEDREKGTIKEGGIPTETPETSTKLSPEEANKRIENIVDEKVKAVEADEDAKKELKDAEDRLAEAEKNLKDAQKKGSSKKIQKAEKELAAAKEEYTTAQSRATETAAARETALTNAKEAWKENSSTGETHARGKLSLLPYGELKEGKGQITRLKEGLNDLINDGLLTGVKKLNDKDTYGEASHAAVKALQAAMGVPQTGIWDEATAKKLKHHPKFKYYRTGGLATSTGPAWLDGTASKPELVLNAVDTKNFIALKDILREVMRDISHVGASNDITNMAPTEFNININVDKIANDYDVDKLAARIKKDIVKDASYRNVTSIRHLR